MFPPANKLILLSFLCGILLNISAQQYGYVQYHGESSAPFNTTNTVIQDKEGFIWIGSESGLYRFDGINFEIYSIHTESQFIHKLQHYQNNLLFLNDKGLYEIENVSNQPQLKTLIEGSIIQNDSLPFYPNDFIVSKNNTIWFSQSNHSIGQWKNNEYQTYYFSSSENAQKLFIQKDPNGSIWVLSAQDGLFQFNESTNTFDKKLNIKNSTAFLIHKNKFLIGNQSLNIYSRSNSSFRLLKSISLEKDSVTAIKTDKNDLYYVGTVNGNLFKIQDLSSPPQYIYGANEAHRVEKLNFGRINEISITKDAGSTTDKLWISSTTGLWHLKQRFFKTVDNLPMNNPIGIALNDDGKLWIPINYLFEVSKKQDGFIAEPILDNLQVNYVAHDKSGAIWVTTSTPKVELLKYNDNQLVKRYDFHDRGESIFYLYPDKDGNLWFNQAPIDKPIIGTAQIDSNGEVIYYDETKGFTSRVLALKESHRGEIYAVGIGERSYLYKLDKNNDTFINLSPELPFTPILNFEAHDLTIDERGIVWLATTDGLLRYDGEKIVLVENDILGQEEIRGVTHYSNNNIWLATATKGLVFHQGTTSTVLGETEGLPATISAYRCITTDKDGRLWAGTAEGLVFSRASASDLPLSLTPKITKSFIDGDEFQPDVKDVIKIKSGARLELQLTNLSYPAKNVQYQYRILPLRDKELLLEEQIWQSKIEGNMLQLDNIDLGNHFLELRARQPGGYQWSEPMNIQLNVFIPWYEKTWFKYALSVLVIALIGYYFRFYALRRFRRLQKVLKYSNEKLAQKEELLNQKIKELEDKGDKLVSATSNIQTLELFIKEIPQNASWNDIITAMGKAVMQTSDVNAFEIAFKENNEIVHKGYSDQERSGYTFRAKAFCTKTSLTCWAMENNKEVLINDFIKEHTMYIEEKEAYRFSSLLFIPFTLENDQPVVLCAYSTHKNHFDNNDQVMFRILAQYIYSNVQQEISKEL